MLGETIMDDTYYGETKYTDFYKKQYFDKILSKYKQNLLAKEKTIFRLQHLSLEFDSCILSDNETYKIMSKYDY